MVYSWRFVLPSIPVVMLTLAIPLVNRIEPRIFGIPFLAGWIAIWVLLTPLFLYALYRVEKQP